MLIWSPPLMLVQCRRISTDSSLCNRVTWLFRLPRLARRGKCASRSEKERVEHRDDTRFRITFPLEIVNNNNDDHDINRGIAQSRVARKPIQVVSVHVLVCTCLTLHIRRGTMLQDCVPANACTHWPAQRRPPLRLIGCTRRALFF